MKDKFPIPWQFHTDEKRRESVQSMVPILFAPVLLTLVSASILKRKRIKTKMKVNWKTIYTIILFIIPRTFLWSELFWNLFCDYNSYSALGNSSIFHLLQVIFNAQIYFTFILTKSYPSYRSKVLSERDDGKEYTEQMSNMAGYNR